VAAVGVGMPSKPLSDCYHRLTLCEVLRDTVAT